MPHDSLTLEEKATNHETWTHIHTVQRTMRDFVARLVQRALYHDSSKLGPPEVSTFTRVTPLLQKLTYGSDEYKRTLKEMGPALQHHYENNRHHPEYHEHGVDDMNLVDLVEMLCDWRAATLRHADGDLRASLETNIKRFQISPQLANILLNSIKDFGWEEHPTPKIPH